MFALQKSGKWCAVHVRVAWEIYHHQQKQQAEAANKTPDGKVPEGLRPPAHLLPPGATMRPGDIPGTGNISKKKSSKFSARQIVYNQFP